MFSRLRAALPDLILPVSIAGGLSSLALLGPAAEIAERESPRDAASHYNGEDQAVPLLTKEHISHLSRHGYVVVDSVLSRDALIAARRDALACIFEKTEQHNDSVRTDLIIWSRESAEADGANLPRDVAKEPTSYGLLFAQRKLRTVAQCLESHGWSGFDRPRMHVLDQVGRLLGVPRASQLATYPPRERHQQSEFSAAETGTVAPELPRYRAHRDANAVQWYNVLGLLSSAGINQRAISCVLYLSDPDDWQADVRSTHEWPATSASSHPSSHSTQSCGGELLLYLGAEAADDLGTSAKTVLAVAPVGGRLVVFDSAVVLHEVLPHTSERARIAITSWIGGRHSHFGFLRRWGLTHFDKSA